MTSTSPGGGEEDRDDDYDDHRARRWRWELHSLRVGWRNLPTLRVGWRNFFSSCAVDEYDMLCQFFVLAGNRFWFYILLMYLGYRTIQLWCCVSFWFWREIVFGVTYVLPIEGKI